MPDDKKADDCDFTTGAPKGGLFTPLIDPLIHKLGGRDILKTEAASCKAEEDGRYGYAALMALKALFHDIPVHQFSSGDKPKPADTPVVKTTDSKAQGK